MEDLLRSVTTGETLTTALLIGEFVLAFIMKKLNDKLERLNNKEDKRMNDVLSRLEKIDTWMNS